jgi:hypothetical protein
MGDRDFDCAICLRRVCMRWTAGRRFDPVAPLCRWCEQTYGGNGRGQSAGSFRDRREVIRGIALSEALRSEAAQQNWRQRHASA